LNATSEHEQINILRKGSNFKIFSTSRNQQTTQSKKEEKKMNLLHSLLLLLPLLLFITTKSTATIPPGSSLYASNTSRTWSSPNNTFFLGFTQVGTSYTVSISYAAGVAIWTTDSVVSGTASAAVVDSGGVFQFLRNGNLRLVNGSGATVWTSNTAKLGVTSASLDDTGNLVLAANTFAVWSSFENPTDTLVPSQNLTVNQTLRSGVHSFRLLSNGNITLTWNDSVVYWNQGLSSLSALNVTSPTLRLQPNGILTLSDASLRRSENVAFGNDYGEGADVMRFLRFSDGNLRMYSGGTTTMTWAVLADQCQVYGYCGNMGICSYNESNSSPICKCPSLNFEAVDVNDRRKGCKRKVEVEDCVGNVTMLELKQTKFFTFQAQQIVSIGITACRVNCLSSTSCFASTSFSDTNVWCYLKNSPDFVSGYQGPVLLSTSYVKVCGTVQPNPSPLQQSGGDKKCWKLRVWVVGFVVVVTILVMAALAGLFWWFCCKTSPKFGGVWAQYTLLEYASGAPVQFSYKDLHRWTKRFKDKLGAGGFGAVYRGVLANRTVVAVKQLEGIEQGEKQFRMEVATISSTHHLNLVRLIGFCSEGRHRLLVYEFMKNGSLDHFLFRTEDQSEKLLNWKNRFNIALGTARGITYLHEECRDCIVHCDIKPENILLDENFNAKVSDFGLAKLISTKDQRYRSLTSIRGTRGYLAPEWLANLPITSKSDVYSYGMVLLEIVSGRRNFEVSAEINEKKFSEWAYGEFEKGNVAAIVDKRLADQGVDMEQVMRAVQVSFWCFQEHPSQRPTMGKVVQMLEGIIEIAMPPAPKALTEGSSCGTSTSLSSKDGAHSTYEASAPPPSSSSSFQTAGISPFISERIMEKQSSSFLGSFQTKSR